MVNMRDLAFAWLDYILKGKAKPELLKDRVNYQVMGANEWKHVSSLDKMNNDTLIFYLNTLKLKDNYLLSKNKPKADDFVLQINASSIEKRRIDLARRLDQELNVKQAELVRYRIMRDYMARLIGMLSPSSQKAMRAACPNCCPSATSG